MSEETLQQTIDSLSNMTALQLLDLSKRLQEEWGVNPAAAVAAGAQAQDGGGAAAAEEKTEFSVQIASFDAGKKIAIIKLLRELKGLSLGEAKAMAESIAAGEKLAVAEDVDKDKANEIKASLEEAGATVEIS